MGTATGKSITGSRVEDQRSAVELFPSLEQPGSCEVR